MNKQEPPNTPSEALKMHVNKLGELHLNAEMTVRLIQWVNSQEKHLQEAMDSMGELLKLLEPILSAAQVADLKNQFRHLGELTRR